MVKIEITRRCIGCLINCTMHETIEIGDRKKEDVVMFTYCPSSGHKVHWDHRIRDCTEEENAMIGLGALFG